MPITSQTNLLTIILTSPYFLSVLKFAILIILLFYAIFGLIVVRQVDLMSKTLVTNISPIVKFLSIIQVGLAIGLIILAWGIL